MEGATIVSQIISILTAGIVPMGTALGQGIMALIDNLWFTTVGDTKQMSIFAVLTVVFAGIGLAIGLGRKVLSWLGGLGGRHM